MLNRGFKELCRWLHKLQIVNFPYTNYLFQHDTYSDLTDKYSSFKYVLNISKISKFITDNSEYRTTLKTGGEITYFAAWN